ncbi:efflux RND transporter permease subunit [Thalassolituus alkanivorans]|uniref:efflux RND transporter permease subunit n=1 Tax=Thalassolituus alkanivorans TaxID=2881055 RepID=UPI001E368C88|nr:efflux RND transporter permease subunit [Thalassolituus alkanivorans]MCB2386870.1 efflux RND transporter permease subunit [Thalassolituus alkanivorans]MCB2425029.1 efflux RND transporter permease subunit [Thalassolituus alkanivorans]
MSLRYTGPVAWMARHGVAPNLLMAFLIIGGFLMSLNIRKEFIPSYEADMVIVSVGYAGATPSEMEQGVILPIENELSGIDGLKEIVSTATQGSAQITAELENGVDRQQAYQDIQQAVNRISTFPAQMERPLVRIASRSIDVIELALFGPLDQFGLKRLGEQIKDQLLESPDITKVELRGINDEEIHVEISQNDLQRYGLKLSDVAAIIGNNAIEQSAGSVKTDGGDILVTLDDRLYWAEEFRQIPLISDISGVQLRLGDVAKVRDGFSDSNREITYNGQTSMSFKVYRAESQTPLTVVEAVYKKLDEIRPQLPPGMSLIITDDDGETYKQRVGLLLKNAVVGLVLVMVLLSLFLEYRLAFWVTMGIPTAFMGAMLLLPGWDMSINMISMFAFIVALGIVVDDAIIAGENIYEHMQKGMPFMDAAIFGAKEVAMPLAFAILTNVAAFLPLLALPGMMGKLFIAIPIVVISCFIISWLEALFILPAHLGRMKKRDVLHDPHWLDRLQQRVDKGLHRFIQTRYLPLLDGSLRAPGLTLAIAVAIALIVLAWPMSGRMGFSMFPRLEGEFAVAKVEMPPNAPLSQAQQVRDLLEARLKEVVDPIEAQGKPLLVSVEGDIENATIEIQAKLVDTEVRPVSANEVVKRWREAIGEIPGIRSLTFDAERGGGPSGGAGLTVELRGSNTELLATASAELGDFMQQLGGVKDVASSFTNGKPQWDIELNERGRSLGLEADVVAQQIRAALYGARALRQQRERNEVTVLVRLPQEELAFSADIERLMILTPQGGYVPLADIAILHKELSPASISRRDGRQVVTVTAEVEPREQVPAVMAVLREEAFADLRAKYPTLDFDFRGRQADTQESMSSLQLYGFFAMLLIYVLLAIPFRSYSQPLLIMVVIPFGAVGAIIGHLLLGYSMSIMSVMGIVALAGVVVNDSLILIDYANRRRQEAGLSALEAVREAGVRRFRPILLTTLTTFGGLSPMVFETSRQAQFITPMAVSLGFGILFTTFICLLILPSLYVLLDKILLALGITPVHSTASAV